MGSGALRNGGEEYSMGGKEICSLVGFGNDERNANVSLQRGVWELETDLC